jgi:hypothetical protein
MSMPAADDDTPRIGFFERWLTVWVFLCIVLGIGLGQALPDVFRALGAMEVAKVNLPVGVLIWVMIIPMLLRIDFGALHEVKKHWRGIGVTLFINWAVKPFSMALLGYVFIRQVFAPWLPAAQIDSYIAGLILLAAAPCTAMVFVWSQLTRGEPYFTLSQVALNDTIMVFAFAPIVALLLGLSSIIVPWDTLLVSVALYIVVPVALAQAWRRALLARGAAALDATLARPRPVFDFRAVDDPGAAVRLPGQGHPRTTHGDRHAGGADHHPGVFQCRSCLLAQSPLRRRALRGGPIGPDRREQFLRTRGGGGHQPVRFRIGRGAGDRGRRADRSAGDAVGGEDSEHQPRLVRARRGATGLSAIGARSCFQNNVRLKPDPQEQGPASMSGAKLGHKRGALFVGQASA